MTRRGFALQLRSVINGVVVENGIRNLLSQIGQPAFSYRNFSHPEHGALLAKWPLMALIAELPEMRGDPIGQMVAEADRGARSAPAQMNSQNEKPAVSGIFDKYRSEPERSTSDQGQDVRSLLGQISGKRS